MFDTFIYRDFFPFIRQDLSKMFDTFNRIETWLIYHRV